MGVTVVSRTGATGAEACAALQRTTAAARAGRDANQEPDFILYSMGLE
jgi:hypothetical protein